MNKAIKLTVTILFAAVAAIFIGDPTAHMQSFLNGVSVWAYNVLPALFPFMVLSTLALKFTPKTTFSLTKKLFAIDCDGIFLLSLICGYPIGAKAVTDSKTDAETAAAMCSFCSSASPIFMIATVGAKLLADTAATVILVVSQILAVIINGLLYNAGRKGVTSVKIDNKLRPSDVGDTVADSALSVISVGGLIALFYMLSDMIKSYLPKTAGDSIITSYAIGLFEMTNGVIAVCRQANAAAAVTLSSGLLAFGGACVFLQCYSYLGKAGISARGLLKMKITQSAAATVIAFILSVIFL